MQPCERPSLHLCNCSCGTRGARRDTDGESRHIRLKVPKKKSRPLSLQNPWGQVRVSSKQTKIIFGSNRNKPKQDLFRVCFGLFRETKKKKFRFVSVFRTYIQTTETTLSFLKNSQIYSLLNCFWSKR